MGKLFGGFPDMFDFCCIPVWNDDIVMFSPGKLKALSSILIGIHALGLRVAVLQTYTTGTIHSYSNHLQVPRIRTRFV